MIPQITSALSQGFTAKQVIDFLLRQFPSHGKQIQKALSSGYTAEQVLKFLGGGRKALASDIPEMGTEHSRSRKMDIGRRQQVSEGLGKAAGLAGVGIAGGLAAPMAAQALQRAAPQLLGPGSILPKGSSAIQNQLPPTSQQTPPVMPNIQSPSTQQPPVSPSIPNQAPPVQPEGISNISEIVNKLGLAKHIEEFSKNVKDPKGVAALLYNKFPKEMQKLQKEAGKPMEDVIAEYMGSQPEAVKQLDIETTPESAPIKETEMKALPGESTAKVQSRLKLNYAEAAELVKQRDSQEKTSEVEPIKIEKGSLALSPQGVGEVKEIRNGKAIIEVDGKKHQVSEDELEKPKYTEDEIADAYDRMFEMIPEEYRSGYIQWAGYNEDENSLGYIPRGGKYEKIYDITPEEAQMIKEGKGIARTSGEEREGIWVVGEDTRGGVISQIVHDRRRKHEAVKKQQLEFPLDLPKAEKSDRGMKPIFDELSYPRELSKERDRKKAEEERARKKAEKERLKKEKEDEKRKKKRQG